MDELRGIEGTAVREYFDHFEDTLRDGWKMDRRTIRPPEDHTNNAVLKASTASLRTVPRIWVVLGHCSVPVQLSSMLIFVTDNDRTSCVIS